MSGDLIDRTLLQMIGDPEIVGLVAQALELKKEINEKAVFARVRSDLVVKQGGEAVAEKATEYNKKVDVGNFLVDNSKLKSLGWNPSISVRDGILKTLEYFFANNGKYDAIFDALFKSLY